MNTAGFHERSKRVFIEARGLPEAERADFLDRACAGDLVLRAAVVALLGHDTPGAAGTAAMQEPLRAWTREGDDPASAAVPERIGTYTIHGLLGVGGMGIVYRAEQDHPRRPVALKLIRPGLATPSAIRRLQREAQILGLLNHPGIAHVHEAGTADAGFGVQPFFAMELAAGQPLTAHVLAHNLPTRARVELLVKVCEAIDYAHRHGVVHRDLKPGNILVDEHGQPKILDFGVAQVTEGQATLESLHTDPGQLVGTLPYMSPEQCLGDPVAVDARADIYALGVILYEALSGRLPLSLQGLSVPAAIHEIQEGEPTPLGRTDRMLRGDLDTVVAKAMAKDPGLRYASVAALAEDLRRFLRDEPIAARPLSTLYHVRRFARRHKALVGGVLAVLVVLVAGIVTTTALLVQVHSAEAVARQRLQNSLDLAGSLNSRVAEDLAYLAGATAARLRIHESALSVMELLAADDPISQWGLGYAHQRVGEARLAIGRPGAALESHLASLAARESDLRAAPESTAALRQMVVCAWRLGEVHLILGHHREALRFEEQALGYLEALHTRTGRRNAPYDAHAWRRIAFLKANVGDQPGAQAAYRKSLEACDEIARQTELYPPAVASHQGRQHVDLIFVHGAHSQALCGLAELLLEQDRPADALTHLDQAVALVLAMQPESTRWNLWHRSQSVRCHLDRARALVRVGRSPEALAAARSALELATSLTQDDSDHFPSKHLQAQALAELARQEHRAGVPAAQQHGEQAVTQLRALVAFDPDHALVRRDLGRTLCGLARAQAQAEQSALAADLEEGIRILTDLDREEKLSAVDAAWLARVRREAGERRR